MSVKPWWRRPAYGCTGVRNWHRGWWEWARRALFSGIHLQTFVAFIRVARNVQATQRPPGKSVVVCVAVNVVIVAAFGNNVSLTVNSEKKPLSVFSILLKKKEKKPKCLSDRCCSYCGDETKKKFWCRWTITATKKIPWNRSKIPPIVLVINSNNNTSNTEKGVVAGCKGQQQQQQQQHQHQQQQKDRVRRRIDLLLFGAGECDCCGKMKWEEAVEGRCRGYFAFAGSWPLSASKMSPLRSTDEVSLSYSSQLIQIPFCQCVVLQPSVHDFDLDRIRVESRSGLFQVEISISNFQRCN